MLLVFIFIPIILIIFFIYSCNVKLKIIINDKGYRIIIYIFILKKICVYKIDSNELVKNFKKKKTKLIYDRKNIIDIIRRLKLIGEEINIKILIGTAEVQSTAIITGLLNSIIGIIFSYLNIKITRDNFKYKVIPIYSNKKAFHIKIKCIFSSSLVHIISAFTRKKIGDVRNGRKSSNRRAYGYRYE